MGRVLLCTGRYAGKPYFVDKVYANIYSVEELCYCLLQDGCLLDTELMDGKLTDWLMEECGLLELAGELNAMMKKKCSVSDFAGAILRYAGYGSEEEIRRAEESLKNGTGLTTYEKKKMRADYYMENRRYMAALKIYDTLVQELPDEDRAAKAKVFHNRGTAYAGLFQFENAAESFRQAYELDGAEESCEAWLLASRMWMDETQYVNFVSEQAVDYALSLRVEQRMEDAVREFEGTEESRMLFTLKVCKDEGNSVSYYDEVERITNGMKEEYREITGE